jgi:dipeptidyl-peptidase 4
VIARCRVLLILTIGFAPLVVDARSQFVHQRSNGASESRERSAPSERRARERAGESEGRSPSAGTIDAFLAPAYPYELVAAAGADRIAWLSYERGRRNVYTAAAPAFRPLKLTRHHEDDGIDLTSLRISVDGSVVVFVRGHQPNRDGWVANPASSPAGARRTIWAARTAGGAAWRIAEGGDPVLSPDGRSLLYVKDGQIYRARVSAVPGPSSVEPPKPFITAFGDNSDPVWSPDGSRIAFVSERGDHSLIAVYDVRSKAMTYVAPSVDRDSSPTWSPDGRRIAFIRRPGSTFAQIVAQNAAAGRGQGRGNQGGGRAGRGAQTEDGPQIPGLTRAVFKGGYTLSFWVAEIKRGPVVASSDESLAREFWHNAPADAAFARVNAIRWAGDHVVFQAEPEEWIRYYSVPIAGSTGAPAELTPGDGMVETVALSSDGRELFYSTNAGDIDRRHLWKVPTAGGRAVQITSGADIETYPAVLASGKHVALLSAAAARPQSVGLAPTAGGAVRVLFPTLGAAFPAADHVTPENVTLAAEDGVKFNNQLFVPKGLRPGERRPALIFVHGGPQRQMLLGYHYRHFYHMAYGVNQWLASQGYVVLSVNYRSGIGYGRSFRMAQNTGQRGNAEYRDVLAAGRYLQGRADVDPKRVGIWGLSYGGILTAQALARNSDIFIAGVDLAGVHLWGNSIDRDSVAYQSSAISQIDKWKSPVLLVHGDDDRNVAFSQTTGLVQLLRARDIYHELIVFPDDVHDSLLYNRWIYTFERMDRFLQKFMGATRKITTE